MNSRLSRICLGFLVLNALIALGGIHHPRPLTVTFLDVGQGDAAVIETPGGRTILIDTGPIASSGSRDAGRQIVEPFLRHEGINRVDAILLTHPHADHIGGADAIINDMPTGLVIDNGEPTEPPLEQKLRADADARHTPAAVGVRGEAIDLGDGVKLQLLAPTPAETEADMPNNASIVVLLTYGRTRFLFMGDAEAAEEEDLERTTLLPHCDVLKVGHHGSRTSSTEELLQEVHPGVAVISVGAGNRYGHPDREVLDRLSSIGARVLRTDEKGAVTCRSDGARVTTETVK